MKAPSTHTTSGTDEGVKDWKVEEIVGDRMVLIDKVKDYQLLIRWEGYPETKDTW